MNRFFLDIAARFPVRPTRRRKEAAAQEACVKREVALIAAAKLMDTEWYLEANPDVSEAAMDPIYHYVAFGAYEG